MRAELKLEHHNIVLLPGWDGTVRPLEPFLQLLPASFRPYVVQFPSDQDIHYHRLVSAVREVVPWDENYLVVADSFSAPLALLFAQAQWENIDAIVLCSPFVRNPLPVWWDRLFNLAGPWLFYKPIPDTFLKQYFLGLDASPNLVEIVGSSLRGLSPQRLAQRVALARAVDVTQALREVKVPILNLAASQDAFLGARARSVIAQVRPDAAWLEVEGPHMLLQARPKQVWAAIEYHLKRLFPAAAA